MTGPSQFRLLWLFVRTAVRRSLNRCGKLKLVKSKNPPTGAAERGATLHRSLKKTWGSRLAGTGLALCMVAGWLMIVFGTASQVVDMHLLHQMRTQQQITISAEDFSRLKDAAALADAAAQKEALDDVLDHLLGSPRGAINSEASKIAHEHFADAGMAGFVVAQPDEPWSGSFGMLTSADRGEALRSMGLFFLLMNLAAIGLTLGINGGSLTGDGSSLPWLMQFPVSRRLLFLGKLVEYTCDTPLALLNALVAGIVLFCYGCSLLVSWSMMLGLGLSAALTAAAVRLAMEVLLTQKFSRQVRGLTISVVTATGSVAMFALLGCANSLTLCEILGSAAQAIPDVLYCNSLTLGFGCAAMGAGLASGWWVVPPLMALGLSAVAVGLSVRLTAFGLEPQISSGRAAALTMPTAIEPAAESTGDSVGRWRGMAWKEWMQLRRQPELLGRTLGGTMLMAAYLCIILPAWSVNLSTQDARGTCAAIFAMIGYMLVTAGSGSLLGEMKSLWLWQSQPQSLADGIRTKAGVWSVVALATALTLAVATTIVRPAGLLDVLSRLPFMLVALWLATETIFGLLSLELTVIGEQTVAFRKTALLLPFIIISSLAAAVYSGDVWLQLIDIVQLLVLRTGLRQKQQCELAWLTEPDLAPPRQLNVLHGMIAVFAFSCLQAVFTGLLLAAELERGKVLAAAYALSAVCIGLGCWMWMHRNQLRVLPESTARPVLMPLVVGLVTACSAGAGLVALLRVLRPELDSGLVLLDAKNGGALDSAALIFAAAIVLVAPPFEEWLFRGLLLQGLRRSHGAALSVALSALFFTVLHPLVSLPGVLTLGLVTALLVQRTGRLWPGIVVHVLYNATVVAAWNLLA